MDTTPNDRRHDRSVPWPVPPQATDREMPLKAACRPGYFGIAALLADTERPNDQRVPDVVRSSNRTPHAPTARPRCAPARTWWKLAFAAVLCIATAGQTESATADECTGQILKVVKKNITMTLLKDDAGAPAKAKIRKKGSAMTMPLCVLHNEHKKRRYRIRLPGGGEALIHRRYVLEATDKPPVVINCDGYIVYVPGQAGGVRGSGEDPCD